eukprot:TRINITY_DN6572_c0_g1_i8.p1 TRINITY_DN6572_c0_g1~~TRINITY_DN6572_c0_g1_i8.p1  ORF type:complete len:108 (-),score=14.94 TRINITY_DN6572_c0_g1_i8:166-489(-)
MLEFHSTADSFSAVSWKSDSYSPPMGIVHFLHQTIKKMAREKNKSFFHATKKSSGFGLRARFFPRIPGIHVWWLFGIFRCWNSEMLLNSVISEFSVSFMPKFPPEKS